MNSGTYTVTSQGGNTWLDSALYTTTGATAQLTLTSYTSAPEIDGGKVPLAMLLLGLLFVVSKRKRAGAIAAF